MSSDWPFGLSAAQFWGAIVGIVVGVVVVGVIVYLLYKRLFSEPYSPPLLTDEHFPVYGAMDISPRRRRPSGSFVPLDDTVVDLRPIVMSDKNRPRDSTSESTEDDSEDDDNFTWSNIEPSSETDEYSIGGIPSPTTSPAQGQRLVSSPTQSSTTSTVAVSTVARGNEEDKREKKPNPFAKRSASPLNLSPNEERTGSNPLFTTSDSSSSTPARTSSERQPRSAQLGGSVRHKMKKINATAGEMAASMEENQPMLPAPLDHNAREQKDVDMDHTPVARKKSGRIARSHTGRNDTFVDVPLLPPPMNATSVGSNPLYQTDEIENMPDIQLKEDLVYKPKSKTKESKQYAPLKSTYSESDVDEDFEDSSSRSNSRRNSYYDSDTEDLEPVSLTRTKSKPLPTPRSNHSQTDDSHASTDLPPPMTPHYDFYTISQTQLQHQNYIEIPPPTDLPPELPPSAELFDPATHFQIPDTPPPQFPPPESGPNPFFDSSPANNTNAANDFNNNADLPPSDLPPVFNEYKSSREPQLLPQHQSFATAKPVPPPRKTAAEIEKEKWDRRLNIAKEVYDTELVFNTGLRVIDLQFYKPLIGQGIIEDSLVNVMFPPSIQTVISISDHFLSLLRARLHREPEPTAQTLCLGDAFVELAPMLKNYSDYVNNYVESYNTLSFCQRNYPKFAEFVSKRQTFFVENLLITVIQRSPRYVLFIRDLQKVTPPEHPDHPLLEQALLDVTEAVSYINERKREFDQQKYSIALQMEFNIQVDYNRTLIHEEKVWNRPNPSGATLSETYKFVIFSDFVLLVKFIDGKVVKGKKYPFGRHSLRILKDCVATQFEYHSETYYTENSSNRQALIDACKRIGINVYNELDGTNSNPNAGSINPSSVGSPRERQSKKVSEHASDMLKSTSSSVDDAVDALSDTMDRLTKRASRSSNAALKKDRSSKEKEGAGTMKSVKKKSKNLVGNLFKNDGK